MDDDELWLLWNELDALGEDDVRTKLANRVYGPKERPLVEEWLLRRERKRDDAATERGAAIADEQIRIDRSAKNTAWASVVISVIALVVACIALFVDLKH